MNRRVAISILGTTLDMGGRSDRWKRWRPNVALTQQPTYRFVVADSRGARDGRALDTLGHYNPRQEPVEINVDAEKAAKWLSQGAQPSDTVARLFRQVGILPAR